MKKIVYRNIAKDCAKFFFLTIFTISLIIWVLQAVNYLDFVVEDGHGFMVYFNYTLLSFPKIFSRIFPFAVFLSFTYILLKYENKNELVIFWNFGIKKINFINFFIKLSFFFVLLSLLLNALIVPITQNKARSFIRASDLDFFESILKPKQFIDIVRNLTIYFDEKAKDGELKNIFLNDKVGTNQSQTTVAKTGKLEVRGDRKIMVLYNGKTIDYKNGKISEFKFTKTDFNITRFGSKSTTDQKTQENSTLELIKCALFFKNVNKNFNINPLEKINNCVFRNLENIYEELYVRLVKPLYITFLVMICLLLILKSKNDHTFKFYKLKIYFFGFLFIIFLESSSKFITANIIQNLFMSALPLLVSFVIYIFFLNTLKVNKV
jgi:lipopolysaccharide export system permease protein|tara:strand:+ start:1386 stop:2522 length:1137 start_codon:yes stop_codon:yes gene_type:complete